MWLRYYDYFSFHLIIIVRIADELDIKATVACYSSTTVLCVLLGLGKSEDPPREMLERRTRHFDYMVLSSP